MLVDLGPAPTKKKAGLIDLGPAPTPITEALTAVEEPAVAEPDITKPIRPPIAEKQPMAFELPADPLDTAIRGITELAQFEKEYKPTFVDRATVAAARATGIPQAFRAKEAGVAKGALVPSPEELEKMPWYKKMPEYTGWAAETIVELATLHGIFKSIGLLQKLPKSATAINKAVEMAKWFGGTEAVRQAGRRLTQQDTEGATAILKSAGIGFALSLGLSGAGVLGRKLFTPTEKKLALRVLGLKKTATEPQIRQAMKDLGKKVRTGEVSSKDYKTINELYNRWLKRQPDIVYARAKAKPTPAQITGAAPTVAEITPTKPKVAIKPAVKAKPTPPAPKVAPVAEGKVVDLSKRADVAFRENDLDAMQAIVQESWELPETPEAKALARKIQILDGEMVARRKPPTPSALERKPAKLTVAQQKEYKRLQDLKALYTGTEKFGMTEQKQLADLEALAKPKLVDLGPAPKVVAEKPTVDWVDSKVADVARQKAMKLADKTGSPHFIYPDKSGKIHISRNIPSAKTHPQFTGEYSTVATTKEEKMMEEALAKPALRKPRKPGFVDVTPVLKAHKTFMGILEPSKAVERKLGKEAYAAVIKAIHTPEVGRLEFNQAELVGHDKTIQQLGDWFEQFPDKDLKNLMASRGQPTTVNAELIKREAMRQLPKELRTSKVFNAIQQIANFNYQYLQKVAGDDINKVADYFYGIYKDAKKVDKFLDYWRTTKRFIKEKKVPTVADALDYGLELRNYNPVTNLKAEYVAIAHLEGMNWLKDELMRTGKGKFIDKMFDAPIEWEKVNDPVFRELRVEPDLAKLINNLIAKNKITRVPILNTVRQVNNFLRTVKFIGSAFHLLSVAKQSVADSGYLGFLYKPTATRGFTTGFRKFDPIFKTTQYKDYIRHGGGHRYSVESEARRAFTSAVNELNKNMGRAVRFGALPLRIPTGFVNWMFRNYIPKVKYAKYLDNIVEQEKKLGRPLKSSEKIDIIKEQQNFYGMMNERLFGRSGTTTTALRFIFMAPGYAEGNFRTIMKGTIQWGGKKGVRANRSRSNIVNSLILTGIAATVGTMIMTGKPPKKPETTEELRDIFKIDTGYKDKRGKPMMIDMLTYDKDYWNMAFNILRLRPDVAVDKSVKRLGGMKAPTADMAYDLYAIATGKALYDWKEDKVYYITDPFLTKVMKTVIHELKRTIPISASVYKQSREKGIDEVISAVEMVLGLRPARTERDRKEFEILRDIWSLQDQREKLSYRLDRYGDPMGAVKKYNETIHKIIDAKFITPELKQKACKQLIDETKVIYWKRFPPKKLSDSEIRKAIAKSTYKKPYKRDGRAYPVGHPHKGKEEYVKSLREELRKRKEKRMLRK